MHHVEPYGHLGSGPAILNADAGPRGVLYVKSTSELSRYANIRPDLPVGALI